MTPMLGLCIISCWFNEKNGPQPNRYEPFISPGGKGYLRMPAVFSFLFSTISSANMMQ